MLTKAEPVVRRQKNSGSSDSESKRTEKVKLESRDIKQEHVIEISSDSDVDTDSLMFEPTQRVVKEESTDENDMMFEPSQKIESCKTESNQITQRDVELAPANVIEGQNRQAMGWALKATTLIKRLSEKQKNYLIAKFNIGLQTGNKEDPDSVAEEMKYATQNGSRIFSSTEFLTPLQISSFFSRHARKTDALRETLITEVEKSLTTSV
ncbi:Hypothetical predicted protein [Mytilus galloprovincialis]|uniref:Uncharacterized protein n=1 Tax=Mytilus galloprovincialis TaxID=29158 RepID=A0A8B6FEI8_MYTGA|nr:Hypothetical predicted protein [Mytilus galloprovincialis]